MLVISIITMIIILNIVIIVFSINNKNNSDSLNRENCPGHLLERKLRGSLTYLHASSQLNIVFEAVTQNRSTGFLGIMQGHHLVLWTLYIF